MTVKQLRNKLKNLPENAVVTIPNSNMYNNGDYDIDLVQYWEEDIQVCLEVCLESHYKKNYSKNF